MSLKTRIARTYVELPHPQFCDRKRYSAPSDVPRCQILTWAARYVDHLNTRDFTTRRHHIEGKPDQCVLLYPGRLHDDHKPDRCIGRQASNSTISPPGTESVE